MIKCLSAFALVLLMVPQPLRADDVRPRWTEVAQGGCVALSAGAPMSAWRLNLGVQEHRDQALFASPPNEGLTSYFVAPDGLLGDWSGLSTLTFEKMSYGGDYYPPDSYGAFGDVVIRNGDMTASFTIEQDHSGEWRRFQVPLRDTGWSLSGGAEDVGDILACVSDFRIRAEYGVGTDHAALRGVSLD